MKFLGTPVNAGANTENDPGMQSSLSRRGFLALAGMAAGSGVILDACRRGPSTSIFLGSGDTGLINYLYVIAQVQAGFYTQAYATPYYNSLSTQASEYAFLKDLRDHQLAYLGLFQRLLGSSAVTNVVLQLSQVIFADRNSTLSHATSLQDWAVGAYNGVAQLLKNTSYIPVIAKIAAVEGRHAEYVRDALNYNTFGDGTVVDTNGLGQALSPNVVLPFFETYIQTKLDGSSLPSF